MCIEYVVCVYSFTTIHHDGMNVFIFTKYGNAIGLTKEVCISLPHGITHCGIPCPVTSSHPAFCLRFYGIESAI